MIWKGDPLGKGVKLKMEGKTSGLDKKARRSLSSKSRLHTHWLFWLPK